MKFSDIIVSKEQQTGATRRSRACAEIYLAPRIAPMGVYVHRAEGCAKTK